MVYRFRVTYEEHEDVYRDIDIKASQSFHDFHCIIQQAISFDNSKPAFFYTCDDYWRKEETIPMEIKSAEKKIKRNETLPKRKAIADYVNDPHQKFVYVFDPENEWTFTIELLKIFPEDSGIPYPVCIKSYGNPPKQYKETNLPPPPEEEDDDEPKKIKDGKEKLMEVAEEHATAEEDEDIIPLRHNDEEESRAEDEEGESSEGIGLDDED
ncbi:MAG: hypothetical protein HY063_10565 [Bacteroidetes bacterium]|nr:hypothetical protein [Bacteroidota bacterium]